MMERRAFMGGAMAMAAALLTFPSNAQEVPNSTGTGRPRLKAPAGACDCHVHIYDPERFAFVPSNRVPASHAALPQYELLRQRIGTTRVVFVTPQNYANDNRATADAIAQLGADARGIAVLYPTVSDAQLKTLHDSGIRGIRFTLGNTSTGDITPSAIEAFAKRVAGLGWHVQLNMGGNLIVELAELLNRLPTQIVFDHMANPPLPEGINHPSHAIVRGLLDKGHAWVKLSGAYLNSRMGPPSYPEATTIARAFVQAAPERLVWGSDWPHPTQPDDRKPDDALLFDLLLEWAPDEATRNAILVRNPQQLYGFATVQER